MHDVLPVARLTVMSVRLSGPARALMIAAFAWIYTGNARATTVRHSELPDLVAASHVVVRAHVAFVDDRAGEAESKFKTRIGLEVDEAVKGTAGEPTLELVLPGGKNKLLTMHIPGMPAFAPGDEVVILLTHTAGGDAISGMGEGVFKVDRSGAEARVHQPFVGALHVVDASGRELRSAGIATSLAELMGRLHGYARGEAR